MAAASTPILVLLALITVQVLFGMNYVISKVVVDHFPPLVWASFRAIVSAIVLSGICLLMKRKHPVKNRTFFVPLIAFALLSVVINQASFLVGLHYTTSTNSAILNTLIPIFTLLIVTVRGQEPVTLPRIIGFFTAFAGVLVIRRVEQFTLSDTTMVGDLLTILNCFSYACFLSWGRKFVQTHDRMWTTAWLFMYGSVGLTAIAMPDWIHFHMPALNSTLVGCMLFAVLGGTLATYFLNNWALAYARSSQVALFIYLQPIVAALLAWMWWGQIPTLRTVLSSFLIFVGMILSMAQKDIKKVSLAPPTKA